MNISTKTTIHCPETTKLDYEDEKDPLKSRTINSSIKKAISVCKPSPLSRYPDSNRPGGDPWETGQAARRPSNQGKQRPGPLPTASTNHPMPHAPRAAKLDDRPKIIPAPSQERTHSTLASASSYFTFPCVCVTANLAAHIRKTATLLRPPSDAPTQQGRGPRL